MNKWQKDSKSHEKLNLFGRRILKTVKRKRK